MIKCFLFPQTYLARDVSESLACCFDEVYLLRPPGLPEDQVDISGRRLEALKFLEPSQKSEDIDLDPAKLKNAMQQWENWIGRHKGSGRLEVLKTGVTPPPPDRESTRAIMNQLRSGPPPEKKRDDPPSASPGLVLKLAHLMGKQEEELRSLAEGIDAKQEHMSELLGGYQDQAPPTQFQKIAPGLLGSMSLEMEDETLTDYRLKAWASLAPFESIEDLTPLTLSPQAASLLLERANLVIEGRPARSAAARRNLFWPPATPSNSDINMAREALRLRLPGPEEAAGFKEALVMMLKALGKAPLSSDLLGSLQEIGRAWLKPDGPSKPGECLVLLVFPGFSLTGLLHLMKGQSGNPENTGASCPLWVLW